MHFGKLKTVKDLTLTTCPYRQKCRVRYCSVILGAKPSNQTHVVGMLFPKPSFKKKLKHLNYKLVYIMA